MSKDWFVTNRPFIKDKAIYSAGEMGQILEKHGSWESAKFALGFTKDEINNWISTGKPILEVGPGWGAAYDQLEQHGVNVFVLEPSLKYKDDDTDKLKETYFTEKRRGKVSSNDAADAHSAFPNVKFEVAFAIGPNFQSYARTPEILIDGITGILGSLEDNKKAFLSFGLSNLSQCEFVIQQERGTGSKYFDLATFFQKYGVKYEVKPFFEGNRLLEYAIRIYRVNDNGEDALDLLKKVPRDDLSQYVSDSRNRS